jgi:hypothetical protein
MIDLELSSRSGWALATIAVLACACGGVDVDDPEPAEPPGIAAFGVADDSLEVDRVAPQDDGIAPDGNVDGVFRATLHGPILNLRLVTADDSGQAEFGQEYDTLVGDEPIPPEFGSYYEQGAETWVLGVAEGGASTLLNASDGSATLPVGTHELSLYGASIGFFGTGQLWRLSVELPDHSWVSSDLLQY